MAIGTITKVDQYTVSNRRYRIFDVQCSAGANYTTGGETILPRTVGLNRIINSEAGLAFSSAASTVFKVQYNYTTNKLMVFGNNAVPGAAVADIEVTGNTNLSTFVVRIKFEGT